jgi:hypothetical protein
MRSWDGIDDRQKSRVRTGTAVRRRPCHIDPRTRGHSTTEFVMALIRILNPVTGQVVTIDTARPLAR